MIMRSQSTILDNQTVSNGKRRWKTIKEYEVGKGDLECQSTIPANQTVSNGKRGRKTIKEDEVRKRDLECQSMIPDNKIVSNGKRRRKTIKENEVGKGDLECQSTIPANLTVSYRRRRWKTIEEDDVGKGYLECQSTIPANQTVSNGKMRRKTIKEDEVGKGYLECQSTIPDNQIVSNGKRRRKTIKQNEVGKEDLECQSTIPDNQTVSNGKRRRKTINEDEVGKGDLECQSTIPDDQTISNGKKRWKSIKEDEVGKGDTKSTLVKEKGNSRFRSQDGENDDDDDKGGNNLESSNREAYGFLQWGPGKRSRYSRGKALADETLSALTLQQQQPSNPKFQKRLSSSANTMPHPSSDGASSGPNLRNPTKNTPSSSLVTRNSEDRSLLRSKSPRSNGGTTRVVSSRSREGERLPTPDKKSNEKLNGSCLSSYFLQNQQQEVASTNHCAAGEKVNNSGSGNKVNEWPIIYIPLSRKEKEEDFLAMKGTKLPQRPKKRSKIVDKLTQQQKPRGLKGMESLDISESE